MPTTTTFLRLLAAGDKATALREAAAATRAGAPAHDLYAVGPASFRQVPGSPFAYWVNEKVRKIFARFPALESHGREARRGASTGDDFRRLRLWWEPTPNLIGRSTRWAGMAKGGAFSPYYYDIHLLADWDETRHTYRDFYGRPGREIERPEAVDYYFRPGLTYPRRTQGGFNVRVMPAGCIFADKGPSIFVSNDEPQKLLALLAIVNSAAFRALLAMQMAFGSYEVGVVQRTPVPDLSESDQQSIAALAREAHDRKRDADRDDEVTHPFTLPALARLREFGSCAEALTELVTLAASRDMRLAAIQREIDDCCFQLYGFSAEDRAQVEGAGTVASAGADSAALPENGQETAAGDVEEEDDDGDENAISGKNGSRSDGQPYARYEIGNLLMYAVGCAFGRWDVRIGRDPSLAPELADPFAPLPVCAPGALVGPDGLPATRERIVSAAWLRARPDAITLPDPALVTQLENPAKSATALTTPSASSALDLHIPAESATATGEYPLPVAWDGILVDDPDAPDDIVGRVRLVLEYLWDERAGAVETDACGMLSLRDLREYYRNPRLFFDFHIGRYSKSRRKAPIYWLLQSPKRSYAIWLYYHRLDADLVFKALNFHLLPKIRLEERRLDELKAAKQQAGTTGAEARRAAQAVDRQEALLADLREFRDALDRAARHYLTPDLNDGVLLNIAPFWEVVPWKEAKTAWQQLLAGKYEWSAIGKQLREKGYVRGK